MTHAPARALSAAGLPTWTGPTIVVASLLVGVLLSVLSGSMGVAYALLFACGAVAAVGLVELRGLFLTVAAIPTLFAGATLTGGWALAYLAAPDGAAPFNRTTLVTAAYPLIEKFPLLIIVSLLALTLAVVRLWLGSRRVQTSARTTYAQRRATAAADRRNREQSSRVRERAGTLTVAELQERRRRAKAAAANKQSASAKPAADAASRAERRTDRLGGRDREARRQEQARIPREERLAVPPRTTRTPLIPDPNVRAGQPAEPTTEMPASPAIPVKPTKPATPQRRRLDDDLYS